MQDLQQYAEFYGENAFLMVDERKLREKVIKGDEEGVMVSS